VGRLIVPAAQPSFFFRAQELLSSSAARASTPLHSRLRGDQLCTVAYRWLNTSAPYFFFEFGMTIYDLTSILLFSLISLFFLFFELLSGFLGAGKQSTLPPVRSSS